MKKNLIILTLIIFRTLADAQTLSAPMESAVDICRELSNSIGTSSTAPLKAANKKLKTSGIMNFADLKLSEGKDISVDGHFIFDEEFVDSLIDNRAIIKFAGRYAKKRASRGSTGKKGAVKMTTKALKAGSVAVWNTYNRNIAEYAFLAEPGGMLTVTVRDADGKALYSETKNNRRGEPVRKIRLQLPDKMTKLFIEVRNTGKTDTSFAIIGN